MRSGSNPTSWVASLALTLIVVLSCSGGSTPVSPLVVNGPDAQKDRVAMGSGSGHFLWGFYRISIDPENFSADVVPERQPSDHWNVLTWLENGPCTKCLKITSVTPSGNGTLYVGVALTHPFTGSNLTGFDVRGIVIFNGSHLFPGSGLTFSDRVLGDGELVNADGYTTLYNGTTEGSGPGGLQGYTHGKMSTPTVPNALLNGFRRHITDDPSNVRNAFYAGDKVEVTYEIDMPDGEFVFGYAVDASWEKAVNFPVEDPMTDFGPDANCAEPWRIEVTETPIDGGLNAQGGSTKLTIDIYDWQGKDDEHVPVIECPELFEAPTEASWVEDGDGFTRYEAVIENAKLASAGNYRCLVSKEAEENDPSKPWLDLTAYQVITLEVKPTLWSDATPPWINFPPYDVALDGNCVITASGFYGMHIFDVSDPSNPQWIGRVDIEGFARSIEVSDGYAYVTSSKISDHNVFTVLDIGPPAETHVLAEIDLPGLATSLEGRLDIRLSGGYAFVAEGSAGLDIIDIDPVEAPQLVKTVEGFVSAQGVEIDGGYVFVADTDLGLAIVDIDPVDSASIVSTVATPGEAVDLTVSSGFAIVADGKWNMQDAHVIDVDPVEEAHVVCAIDTPGFHRGIVQAGGYAFLASGVRGLQVIDINNIETATIVKSVETLGEACDVALSGEYACVADVSGGLQIVDIDPPEDAYVVGFVDSVGEIYHVAAEGGCAFVPDGYSGLQIIDVDPIETAYTVASVDMPRGQGVAISGGFAYVCGGTNGDLQIVDIDPVESAYICKTVDISEGWDIAVSDGYACLVDLDFGIMEVADIDPLETAQSVGTVGLPGAGYDVAVMGGYAFIGAGQSGFAIVDVNTPEAPFLQAFFPTDAECRGVAVCDGYAYVCDGWNGLQIYDVDPISSAQAVNCVVTAGSWYSGVAYQNGLAYVADCNYSRLRVLDVDPVPDAHVVYSTNPGQGGFDIAFMDGYSYCAAAGLGLRVTKLE